ncbi:MAG: VOC family protein, partial [Tannerellaceae bacterium]|nr:VOC family protein [Tannerellaceae bacterium]
MKLTHTALWTTQLETMRIFYVKYFNGKSNEKYTNYKKKFSSYFISFSGEASLEIMQREDIREKSERKEHIGLAHIAFQLRSEEQVNKKTELFRSEGYSVVSEPRLTGDGYYESAIADPDGNRVELVALPEISIHKTVDYPYQLLLIADPDK